MAFPQIGLRATLELTGFQKSYQQYQRILHDMDRTTKQTAAGITQAGQNIARSAEQLVDQSKAFDRLFQEADPSSYIDAVMQLGQAWDQLGPKAQVNVDIFDQLGQAGIGMADALRAASGQIYFSLPTFERLRQKGVEAGKAFQIASSTAGTLGQTVSIMGRQFTVGAVGVSALTVVLSAVLKLVRESIADYTELAEATRRLHYQTGLLTEAASGWVQAAELAGISAATSERAMTNFLGKVADTHREMLLGEEITSDFAVALRTLGISITDRQGELRDTESILGDVNRAFQDLGPGVVSAQLATDLFGYSGRYLLPILTDQTASLEEYMHMAEDFGATLTALDRQEYEDFRKANVELKFALQGVKNEIARGWIPVLTDLAGWLARAISNYREFIQHVKIGSRIIAEQTQGLPPLVAAYRLLTLDVRDYWQETEQLVQAEEAAAQSRYDAAQAAAVAAEAERELQKEREKTLEQLGELKTELSRKLLDIERDTAQRYDAIFVDRMRDAMEDMLRLTWTMDDLRADLNQKLADIERDFADRWNDILVQRARDAFENQLRTFWRLIDMQKDYERSRADAIQDAAEREEDIREDNRRRLEELEEDARERREKLERDHQERLAKIQLDYQDTVEEAARQNDAVAVARAMRERVRELRDERKRYEDGQLELKDSLDKKRKDVEEDRREREEDHRAELERTLQRLEENYAQQRADLAVQLERERTLREINYRYEEEDFQAAKKKQQDAAQEWHDKQIADLQLAQERENILNEMHYAQQLEDLETARQEQIDEANRRYQEERDDLAEHLDLTGQQLEAAYMLWQQQAIAAAAEVARAVAKAVATEISRYQQYLPRPAEEIERYRQYLPPEQQPVAGVTPGAGRPPIRRARQLPDGTWVMEQHGGIISANRPTHVMMGEAGPEVAAFMPMGGAMSVSHSFGRLGIDLNGTGAMNTQQIEAVVWKAVTYVAEKLYAERR